MLRWVLAVLLWGIALHAASFPLTILHTNDLHSHFEGNGPDAEFTAKAGDGDPVMGHYARLATLIARERGAKDHAGEPVLLLDAGDFFSGSLYHIIAPRTDTRSAPELEFFKLVGYDAFTLGNHEFDAGEKGLRNILGKGRDHHLLDGLVATNLELRQHDEETERAFGSLPKYQIRTLHHGDQTLKVAILGFQGPDAAHDSSINRKSVFFRGYDDAKGKKKMAELRKFAETMAAQMRANEGAQLVIAVIHAGDPEDKELAKAKGIDLVIAGHSHQLYLTPHSQGDVLVAQAGSYGRFLGKLELSFDGAKLALRNRGATFLKVDDSVPADEKIVAKLREYRREIDHILADTGFRFDTPVTTITEDLVHDNSPNPALGVYVTSRELRSLNKRLAERADVFFTAPSLIREEWTRVAGRPTPVQYSDVFRLLPIGFGAGFRPGSAIVDFYLRPSEMRTLINALELERKLTGKATLTYSDTLTFRVRSYGIPFVNRIADLKLHGQDYDKWPALVHVATTRYVAAFMPKLKSMTHGLVSLSPRDHDGKVVEAPRELSGVPGESILFSESFK